MPTPTEPPPAPAPDPFREAAKRAARGWKEVGPLSFERTAQEIYDAFAPIRDQLRAALARAEAAEKALGERQESYDYVLRKVKEFLAPEWEAAREEVFRDGNQGWTMIVGRAIEKLREERDELRGRLGEDEPSPPPAAEGERREA